MQFGNLGRSGSGARQALAIDFVALLKALAAWKFPDGIEGVVAIANGGTVPGALVAQRLGVGLKTITMSYRNDLDEPEFALPKLVSSVPSLGDWQRVILVDDVFLSGKSLAAARAQLPGRVEIIPFVLVGDVDFALFRQSGQSVHWPWSH